jgi:hypothetical protein
MKIFSFFMIYDSWKKKFYCLKLRYFQFGIYLL